MEPGHVGWNTSGPRAGFAVGLSLGLGLGLAFSLLAAALFVWMRRQGVNL